jgi:hypothetical protein
MYEPDSIEEIEKTYEHIDTTGSSIVRKPSGKLSFSLHEDVTEEALHEVIYFIYNDKVR